MGTEMPKEAEAPTSIFPVASYNCHTGYTSTPFSSLNAKSKNIMIQSQASQPLEQSKALKNKQQNNPINTA